LKCSVLSKTRNGTIKLALHIIMCNVLRRGAATTNRAPSQFGKFTMKHALSPARGSVVHAGMPDTPEFRAWLSGALRALDVSPSKLAVESGGSKNALTRFMGNDECDISLGTAHAAAKRLQEIAASRGVVLDHSDPVEDALLAGLSRTDRRALEKLALIAGAGLPEMACAVIAGYLRLMRDAPGALPKDPMRGLASHARGQGLGS